VITYTKGSDAGQDSPVLLVGQGINGAAENALGLLVAAATGSLNLNDTLGRHGVNR
jgi:hypothetical protein